MYNLTFETSYPIPFSSQFLPLILLSMVGQKHTPITTDVIKNEYDYIIVGAGSAGSVVASRLAEKSCVSVLLLEAGKSPPKLTDVPALALNFAGSDLDWKYFTEPQQGTGENLINRVVPIPTAKAIGGGSIINIMLNVRGNKKNYNDWAAQGAHGWDYDSVLPYFKKLEHNLDEEFVKNGYHGTHGPVFISKVPYDSELKEGIYEAAKELGYRIGDVNGPRQKGFYDLEAAMKNGQRYSAAKAYLVPKEKNNNLDIVSGAFVKKIAIDNKIAQGVEFDFRGKTYHVKANKEIIVSAGAINTPKLLMLSGIGPRKELEKHNIPVISDLPVGENFQDHCAALFPFELDEKIMPFSKKLASNDSIQQYITSKSGPLASLIGVATVAFLDRYDPKRLGDNPEFQLFFWETSISDVSRKMINMDSELYKKYYEPYENKPFYWCLVQALNPKSRGYVKLRSNSSYDAPIIDPMYFTNTYDVKDTIEGLKKCKEIGLSQPMQKIHSKIFPKTYPGCENFVDNEDKYLECIVRSITLSFSHLAGTSKMGHPGDNTAVVDPLLRVKGIHNLRVVDASVMPSLTSGNTMIPTIMIAEKASDFIKKDIQCSA